MVESIQSNGYNQPRYRQRSQAEAEIGFWAASLATGLLYKALPSFSNPFLNQVKKEHNNNHLYKDVFERSVHNSGLAEKGLRFLNTQPSPADNFKIKNGMREAVEHLDIKEGLNACYIPDAKVVMLNADKATISGFHELGHAMNHLNSKFGRFLQKLRKPGYAIAGLMGTIALISRKKPEGEKRNALDFVQDNCGKIAFLSLMPTVIEEAMASHKGIKLAKENGLSEALVKNLKKFYGKALLSYGGYALVTGLAVFVASKITEIFTRPQRIN